MLFGGASIRSSYDDGGVLKVLDVVCELFLWLQFREIDDGEGHLFMQKLVLVRLELI